MRKVFLLGCYAMIATASNEFNFFVCANNESEGIIQLKAQKLSNQKILVNNEHTSIHSLTSQDSINISSQKSKGVIEITITKRFTDDQGRICLEGQ